MAINAMVEKFNADNPDIVLVPNGFPSQEYKQQILNTAFAGGDPPDIFTSVGFVWLQELADAGQVLEITDYYRENLADRYVPGMEFGYSFDGRCLWSALASRRNAVPVLQRRSVIGAWLRTGSA